MFMMAEGAVVPVCHQAHHCEDKAARPLDALPCILLLSGSGITLWG
jgi:hypothetical protein